MGIPPEWECWCHAGHDYGHKKPILIMPLPCGTPNIARAGFDAHQHSHPRQDPGRPSTEHAASARSTPGAATPPTSAGAHHHAERVGQ